MKLAIFSNNVEASQDVTNKIKAELNKHHATAFVFDDKNPDVVISVGGDGTLLAAFHQYEQIIDDVRFIGIHTGHLGFYSDWQQDEVEELVASLLSEQGETVTYPLLDMTVHYEDGHEHHHLALNEAAIKKTSGTLAADVYINGILFERFRGDGLTAATPTGSTGYNKSVGGAVMHPSLEAIQLAEIASINNRVFRTLGSPLIIGKEGWIRVVPQHNGGGDFTMTYDHLVCSGSDIEWLEFKVAAEKVAFAEFRHLEFWHRVKLSFIGSEVD